MIRNLKALGLALVAVFAMGAVVASAASAQQGTLTSDGPVTLHGTQNGLYGVGANALTGFGAKVECEKATYTGHKVLTHAETTAGTKHALLPVPATTTTITPHYGKCTGLGGLPATVDMNGCDYELHVLGTTASPPIDTYGVTTTVKCPTGQHIKMTLWAAGAPHTGPPVCTLTLTEKTDYIAPLDITDNTDGTLSIKGTVNGIETHKEGTAIICNKATTTTGVLHLDIKVSGKNAEGIPTNISLSHP